MSADPSRAIRTSPHPFDGGEACTNDSQMMLSTAIYHLWMRHPGAYNKAALAAWGEFAVLNELGG